MGMPNGSSTALNPWPAFKKSFVYRQSIIQEAKENSLFDVKQAANFVVLSVESLVQLIQILFMQLKKERPILRYMGDYTQA